MIHDEYVKSVFQKLLKLVKAQRMLKLWNNENEYILLISALQVRHHQKICNA